LRFLMNEIFPDFSQTIPVLFFYNYTKRYF